MDRMSRRSVITGLGSCAGVVIGASGPVRAVSASLPPVPIKLGSLPPGAPSRLPWISADNPQQIVVGRRSYPHGSSRAVSRFVAVSDGFVTIDEDPIEAVHVSRSGERTSLGKIREEISHLERETGVGPVTRIVRTGLDGIRVQTAATGATVARLLPGNWFSVAGFHRDQVWFFTEDRTTRVWSVASDTVKVVAPRQVEDVRPAVGVLATHDLDNEFYRVRPLPGNDFTPFSISARQWYDVRISPNGRWLVVDGRNSMRIYSVATGRPSHDFRGHLGLPEWETGDHVITSVADPIADRRALVRIDARTGAFEQASPVQNVYGLTLAHH